MADTAETDLVMRLVRGGNPVTDAVPADCRIVIGEGDEMISDLMRGTYFEINDFDFGVTLASNDKKRSAGTGRPSTQDAARTNRETDRAARDAPPTAKDEAARTKKAEAQAKAADIFAEWRAATGTTYQLLRFPVEAETLSFRRYVDRASPVLFVHCATKRAFKSGTIAKRLNLGDGNGDRSVLRFDFDDLVITSIKSTDGDMVTEACSFVYRKVMITYRALQADNTLAAPASVTWEQQA